MLSRVVHEVNEVWGCEVVITFLDVPRAHLHSLVRRKIFERACGEDTELFDEMKIIRIVNTSSDDQNFRYQIPSAFTRPAVGRVIQELLAITIKHKITIGGIIKSFDLLECEDVIIVSHRPNSYGDVLS